MKIVISIFSIIAGSLLLGCRYLARFHTTEEAFEYVNNIFHDNLINFNTNYTAEEKFSHRVWTFNLKDYPDLVFKVISMKKFYNERDGITSSLNIDVSSVLIEHYLTLFKKDHSAASNWRYGRYKYSEDLNAADIKIIINDIHNLDNINNLIKEFQEYSYKTMPILGDITFNLMIECPSFMESADFYSYRSCTKEAHVSNAYECMQELYEKALEISSVFYYPIAGINEDDMQKWLEKNINHTINLDDYYQRVIALRYKKNTDIYAVEKQENNNSNGIIYISYGAANELFNRMGYSSKQYDDGFEISINGDLYRFSYNFYKNKKYFYIKNGKRIDIDFCNYRQPFNENIFKDMTGKDIREIAEIIKNFN